MTEVRFYDPAFEPDVSLTYSIISARFQNRWIFVRHQDLTTFEIAGGHIEQDENSYVAAERELMEETGALKFDLECVATYAVIKSGTVGYGRLYLAHVYVMGEVPDTSEIAEVILLDNLPGNLTYPDIQPFLFEKSLEYLNQKKPDKRGQK